LHALSLGWEAAARGWVPWPGTDGALDASLRATKPRINRPDVHLILVFFYGMAATFFSLLAQFLAEGTL
jgi:hypothetical protein